MQSKLTAAIVTACGALCACAARPQGGKFVPTTAPQKTAPAIDGSYDWHVLLAAPFGSTLKAVPLSLHEVLIFHDAAAAAVPGGEPECYAPDVPGPRFLGQASGEYLVCFRHDRLSRIEASVGIAAADASQVFAAACTLWRKNAAALGPPPAEECEGRDALVHFRGRLTQDVTGAQLSVSIVLDVADEAQ